MTSILQNVGELLYSPITLVKKLGLKAGIVQWVGHFAGQRYLAFSYPGSARTYFVNFDDEWKFIERGNWAESHALEFARKLVRAGQQVFNIGANVGQYTLFFSELSGTQGKVFAFEPDPKNFLTLKSNLAQNSVGNVVAEQLCISDTRGQATLSSISLGSTTSSIVRYRKARSVIERTRVDAVSLDEYCEEKGVWPEGVKVDVEGAEGLVLNGMVHVVEKCRPWVLLELHGEFLDEKTVRDIWSFIWSRARAVICIGGSRGGYRLGHAFEKEEPPLGAHIQLLILF